MNKRHIALIGLPSSGKSTLGMRLAQALNRPWLDSDQCFETQNNEKIAAVFAAGQEARFRKWESNWLNTLAQLPAAVISTGGGLPCQTGAMDLLKAHCLTVYLKADLTQIWERLQRLQHPMIQNRNQTEFEVLAKGRLPIYAQADWVISTQDSAEKSFALLMNRIKTVIEF
jgi:shikimate kinase